MVVLSVVVILMLLLVELLLMMIYFMFVGCFVDQYWWRGIVLLYVIVISDYVFGMMLRVLNLMCCVVLCVQGNEIDCMSGIVCFVVYWLQVDFFCVQLESICVQMFQDWECFVGIDGMDFDVCVVVEQIVVED